MKRSFINQRIQQAKQFMAEHHFALPPFAFWTPQHWKTLGHEADEIRSCRLGWDLTDFNLGRFDEMGLTLFTVRNGRLDDPKNNKIFAEKIMTCGEGQVTPFHFHWQKTEDIINRGGGELVVELYNSDDNDRFANTPVRVSCDGVERQVSPGGSVLLRPGESITLLPRVYHKFYAKPGTGRVLIGEVSSVNDDATDNRFYEPLPRFPAIEEDQPPLHLLCTEYPPAR